MKCIECEEYEAMHYDPRTPPLGIGFCRCDFCALDAYDNMIDELKQEADEIMIDACKRRKQGPPLFRP